MKFDTQGRNWVPKIGNGVQMMNIAYGLGFMCFGHFIAK